MKIPLASLCLLCALARPAAVAAAAAGEAGPADAARGAGEPEAAKREGVFDFKEAPLSEIAASWRREFRVNIIVDPMLGDAEHGMKVTVAVKGSLRDALAQAASKAGAKLFYANGAYWISREAPRRRNRYAKPAPPLSDDRRQAVRKAIEELADDRFAVREAAEERISKIGRGALPMLEAALAVGPGDLEREVRLSGLVARMSGGLGAQGASGDLKQALKRKVTFCFTDTPLSETCKLLTGLLRNRILLMIDADLERKGFDKAAVTLEVIDMEAADAIEWIATTADLEVLRLGNAVWFVKPELDPDE